MDFRTILKKYAEQFIKDYDKSYDRAFIAIYLKQNDKDEQLLRHTKLIKFLTKKINDKRRLDY